MNKEKLIERLLDREEFKTHWSKNNKDSQLGDLQAQNAVYYQYFERLFNILEEADHKGVVVDDDNVYRYLRTCEGSSGGTKKVVEEGRQRKQKFLSETLKESVVTQVKAVADYAKCDFILHLFEVITVGILIGTLSFVLPYKWNLKASKEPIKVQIIEQTIPQSQSKSIMPENSIIISTKSL